MPSKMMTRLVLIAVIDAESSSVFSKIDSWFILSCSLASSKLCVLKPSCPNLFSSTLKNISCERSLGKDSKSEWVWTKLETCAFWIISSWELCPMWTDGMSGSVSTFFWLDFKDPILEDLLTENISFREKKQLIKTGM